MYLLRGWKGRWENDPQIEERDLKVGKKRVRVRLVGFCFLKLHCIYKNSNFIYINW